MTSARLIGSVPSIPVPATDAGGNASTLPVPAVALLDALGNGQVPPTAYSSGNVANATATATIPGVAGKLSYLSGIMITGTGATAAAVALLSVTGLAGGTISFVYSAVAGALLGNPVFFMSFAAPIPAAAVNTAIVASLPALGLGNTNAVVTLLGYSV